MSFNRLVIAEASHFSRAENVARNQKFMASSETFA
jgi:hypothetical protein